MGYDSTFPSRSCSEMERLRVFLDDQAVRYNTPDFIAGDPVQFPRRFTSLQDCEIAALLVSAIAWGNRKMICRNCDRMLALLDNQPHRFVLEGDIDAIADGNIHRTFFAGNLRHFLRGLRRIYRDHGSLQAFAAAEKIATDPYPAWRLVEGINRQLALANDGECDPRCLPLNLADTALKRVNMALRWLVRNDGIVDIGCWSIIKPSQLFIPLDVHVGNTARRLGLLERKANDRKATIALTETLRKFNPDDPVVYDYALFGAGINAGR